MGIDFNGTGLQIEQTPRRTPPTWAEVQGNAMAELQAHGFLVEGVEQNTLQRCADGDKPQKKDGWYIRFFDEWPRIVGGNWRTGDEFNTPLFNASSLTWEERREANAAHERQKRRREELLKQEADRAAKKAEADLARAIDADNSFPYLVRKGVPCPPGIKLLPCTRPDKPDAPAEPALLVPLHDAQGVLRGYQRIFADGGKFHSAGPGKRGAFFLIPPVGTPVGGAWLHIVEGLATGITVAQAYPGIPVAVCCDCLNLSPVIGGLKAAGRYDGAKTLIIHDNDRETAEDQYAKAKADGTAGVRNIDAFNPGKREARKAAETYGCRCVSGVPDGFVSPDGSKVTDANDLARVAGAQAVHDLIAAAWNSSQTAGETAGLLDDLDEYAPRQGVYEGPPPPYAWLAEWLLEEGELAVLAGPGGSGKSTGATQFVFSVATGKPWLGWYSIGGEPGEAWYFSSEDSQRTLHRRSEAIMETLSPAERGLARRFVRLKHLPSRCSLFKQDPRTKDVVPTDAWRSFSEAVRARKPRLIVLDPISSVTLIPETDNTSMTEALGYLEELCEETGVCILYLHHTQKDKSLLKEASDFEDKLDQTAVRGAGAIVNVPRMAMLMYPISANLANKCLEDGANIQSNGQVVVVKEVKKNGGMLAPARFFRHTSNMGLLEPCLNVRTKFNFNDKDASKEITKLQKLEGQALQLAKLVVEREQDASPRKERVAPSKVFLELGFSDNRDKSIATAAKAVIMELVHNIDHRELVERGLAEKKRGTGRVLLPTAEALRQYGKPDPDRPGEYLNISSELRQWLEAGAPEGDAAEEAKEETGIPEWAMPKASEGAGEAEGDAAEESVETPAESGESGEK